LGAGGGVAVGADELRVARSGGGVAAGRTGAGVGPGATWKATIAPAATIRTPESASTHVRDRDHHDTGAPTRACWPRPRINPHPVVATR
jgi:hypothetical protein